MSDTDELDQLLAELAASQPELDRIFAEAQDELDQLLAELADAPPPEAYFSFPTFNPEVDRIYRAMCRRWKDDQDEPTNPPTA